MRKGVSHDQTISLKVLEGSTFAISGFVIEDIFIDEATVLLGSQN